MITVLNDLWTAVSYQQDRSSRGFELAKAGIALLLEQLIANG